MRQALAIHGSEPALAIDAGEGWSAKEAIQRIRAIELEFDLTWVEAPTRRWDFLGLKRIADAIRAPVCIGRNSSAVGELLPHFNHRSVNILQISAEDGGITSALQKADAAFGFELPVILGAMPGNLNAHLAGALPHVMSLGVVEPIPADGVTGTDVRIEAGWASVGDRAGNGLQLDRTAFGAAA
jgi:L-alanine-DL-glutamate epimerase-like enolase superfamily enzyme